jgi:putative peptidoglycan lipid II flippase
MLQPLILVVGSVATALLNSRNQFLTTALSLLSHNITLIAGILAVRIWPELGIWGPTIGVVSGAVLQVGILAIGLRGQGGRLRLRWNLGDPALHEVARLLIPNGLAVGVGYAGFIIDTSFASKAPEEEAIAAIQNAWLLAGLPVALLGQAAAQAAFPRLSAAAAHEEWQRMKLILVRTLGAVVALAIPAVLVLVVFGRTVVAVLFEHGEFDEAAGSLTSDLLTIYAVALPAYVATEVFTRGLIALKDARTPLFTNIFQLTGRIVIVSLMLDSRGAEAIPFAFAVTAASEAVLLGCILAWKLRGRGALLPPQPAPV